MAFTAVVMGGAAVVGDGFGGVGIVGNGFEARVSGALVDVVFDGVAAGTVVVINIYKRVKYYTLIEKENRNEEQI